MCGWNGRSSRGNPAPERAFPIFCCNCLTNSSGSRKPTQRTRGFLVPGKAPPPSAVRENGAIPEATARIDRSTSRDPLRRYFSQEIQGDVQVLRCRPRDGSVEATDLCGRRRDGLPDTGGKADAEERSHSPSGASDRRTSIAAPSEALTVSRRTASRPPGNRNRCAYRTPPGATTATHTVPTGFPATPAAGPRHAGDGDRKVRPEEGEDPFRHGKRHLAAHRSARGDQVGRNAQQRDSSRDCRTPRRRRKNRGNCRESR